MRMSRIIIAALAISLIGLVPMTASSATAAESSTAPSASAAAAQAAKPARTVKFAFKDTPGRGYKFFGKVQDGNRTKVNLLRADSKRGNYRLFKTKRTTATGNYSWTRLTKAGWYYVKVPGNVKWKTSFSQLIHVYYR